MTKAQIKLVISDIDGTILDSNHQVDDQLKDQIKSLKKQGIPFVLASARSPRGMYGLARELELDQNPIATYNGALIVPSDPEKLDQALVNHVIDPNEAGQLINLLQSQFPTVSINPYAGADWYASAKSPWTDEEAAITQDKPIIKDPQTLLEEGIGINKFLLIDQPDQISRLEDYLNSVNFKHCDFYLSKDNYLEVTAKGVSKENALREIAEVYQVPLENCLAIGDNFNDIPMLQLAGLGIAMANAPQEVQAAADYLTSSNDDHGVSQALRKWVI
ncbi:MULTISPECIES: Cof-type HAD-IIB family hydrolase [Aerococcus]|uniref:Cof-type HAD-IIB family hydrolase n=1 Tax=Aerococcus TaxID=1375 RepID=UPI0018A76CC9|nr:MULTISPECIES: Cof-type HAD-IIB family hydrolase [Aerococcus]MCY3036043.1 Cof-type HAD-IIB family hydrolase [Aerococcus sp. Group 2]MCY3039138.1 Cof-type HAD-IIB family hydrolase [Aerococcus sp. Group 2]MCY3040714.1 Cof-type HAD-IIB family hydrolase [Aerococcus sp. Group 2]MCY3042706.1 Cof-type HAD-IIB family hydrolase [Aerococcus sp. Group 2]MDK6520851.1 Cof-type HAD-IIB family hydrolase [Aerococcus urinae]